MLHIEKKPKNGITRKQPFASGTAESQFFRIPGIISLDNGTLIASCDARWNHDGDGAGLDTLVSCSNDNGKTWNYTFANYLGDNGNCYHDLSTSFIDPAIATDGKTVYLLADLFPAGIALNTSRYQPIAGQNGLDDNGNLKLRLLSKDKCKIGEENYHLSAGEADYAFYLDMNDYFIYSYQDQKKWIIIPLTVCLISEAETEQTATSSSLTPHSSLTQQITCTLQVPQMVFIGVHRSY